MKASDVSCFRFLPVDQNQISDAVPMEDRQKLEEAIQLLAVPCF